LRLTRVGRFGQALQAFKEVAGTIPNRPAAEVLRAQVLAQVGQSESALALATALLKSKTLTIVQRSECEAVVGKIHFDEGDADSGLGHQQRATLTAEQATDPRSTFGAKLFLFMMLSERYGPAAGWSVLGDLRQLATKLGDVDVTAQLHLFVAQAEAKRGLLENAKRHTALARRILRASPNVYLTAFVANLDLAFAVMRSEFDVAKNCGLRAVHLVEQSGNGKLTKAVLGNMGNLYCELGDFDRASAYFEEALATPPEKGVNTTAILESLARVHLLRGRADACLSVLERIESTIRAEQDRLSYEQRHSALTRIHLLAHRGQLQDALNGTEPVLELAMKAGDGFLQKHVLLTRADLLQQLGKASSSAQLIAEISPGLVGQTPELFARSEQILACALESNCCEGSDVHYDRALRVYQSIGSVPRLRELEARWAQARAVHSNVAHSNREINRPSSGGPQAQGVRSALQELATVFTHASRPDLVARELVELATRAKCTHSAAATLQDANGTNQIISQTGSESSDLTDTTRLSGGFKDDREIQLHIRSKTDIESIATVNAFKLLLASLHEVQRSRAEREERATLWPVEELPDIQRSIVTGRMRKLMEDARRIARAKVNVLITGESGTGKEILARAIHDFSDREGKPFVPFNCAAIPRDLLESQLFGHRRGAFTGADRDQLGYIRAARHGTLFLDEIGELGLDLQPKLLRFLESGEISPLGEPGSMTIDVRIVAATNSKLEEAVRNGRFREDLFYRLNVVKLDIPPLRERRDEIPGFVNHFAARAAEEFKKGQLRIAEETMEHLLLYRWPGNVRQLKNEMSRMVALAEPNSTLLPESISDHILEALPVLRHPSTSGEAITVDLHEKLLPAVARVEAEMIRAALKRHGGKVDAVAKALGISRKGLYLKRQRLGL